MGIIKSAKDKLVDMNERRKANNLADKRYENANYKFQKTEAKIPSSVYGKVDISNNKFFCKSDDDLKPGTILKGTQDGSTIKFNILSVYRKQERFEHGIDGIDPIMLDVCDIQVLLK